MNLHFEWTKKTLDGSRFQREAVEHIECKKQKASIPPAPAPCPSSPVLHLAEHRQFLTSPRQPSPATAISLNSIVWRFVQPAAAEADCPNCARSPSRQVTAKSGQFAGPRRS